MKRKKYLGQNFLNNKNILEQMAAAAELTKRDIVLEVGPGKGTLTEILAVRAKKIIAVEKDADLIPFLKEKFRDFKNVKIVEGDILTIPPPLIIKEGVYKIVANIPYYITSHFLRLFLSETKFRPKVMVLMVQKEVAERIMAKDGKESMLSLSVKVYGKSEFVRKVPRGAFSPPPNVDSAIIKITTTPPPLLVKEGAFGIEKILAVARIAFQKKRKMLRQSIGKKIPLPKNYETKRPEELSPDDWLKILRG